MQGRNPHNPIRTLGFRLTRADALAYERLPTRLVGLQRAALLIWLGLSGVALAFLPPGWRGPEESLQFNAALVALMAAQLALAWMARAGLRQVRAGRLVPRDNMVRIEEWGDHLVVQRDGTGNTFVSRDMIRRVTPTGGHVFIEGAFEPLIVPRAAFAGPDDMRDFAAAWAKRKPLSLE